VLDAQCIDLEDMPSCRSGRRGRSGPRWTVPPDQRGSPDIDEFGVKRRIARWTQRFGSWQLAASEQEGVRRGELSDEHAKRPTVEREGVRAERQEVRAIVTGRYRDAQQRRLCRREARGETFIHPRTPIEVASDARQAHHRWNVVHDPVGWIVAERRSQHLVS
jgi:hypothetical protein